MDNPVNTPAPFNEPDEDILAETVSDEALEAAAAPDGLDPFRSFWPGSCW